ncbi:hypothetical protein ES702_02765 [subsurface metagenome]
MLKSCKEKLRSIGKKAQTGLSGLQAAAITFVVVGVTFGVGLQIQGDTKDDLGVDACPTIAGQGTYSYNSTDDLCYNGSEGIVAPTSAEYNASADAIEGNANISGKLPLIGTVIAAVVVIGLIVRNLGRVGQ